jgi:hypothetical protein
MGQSSQATLPPLGFTRGLLNLFEALNYPAAHQHERFLTRVLHDFRKLK